MNQKVAHRSLNNNKRKRATDKLQLAQCLMDLPSFDRSTSSFLPTNTLGVAEIFKAAHEEAYSVSVTNTNVTFTHGNARGGNVVIDLSDPYFQTVDIDLEKSQVRVGAGVTSRIVDTALAAKELSTPLVGYTVGLGAFLSGGFGFSSRLHGLTSDNILEAEIVLADGSVVVATKTSAPDLYWAVCGCGSSFGVVTSLLLKCYPLRGSLSANVIFPFEPNTGADLLKHWRECLEDAPNEMYSNFVIAAGPDAPQGTIAILQICHLGDHEVGMPVIERMAAFSGAKYHFKDCNEITYLRQQELVEAVLKGAAVDKGHKPESQVKYLLAGDAITELSDETIEESCNRFHASAAKGSIWCFELFGGALNEIHDSCVPDALRQSKYHAASIMRVPIDRPDTWRNDTAGRDWIRETINKVSPGGPLPSFLPNSSTDAAEAKKYHDVLRGSYGHENWSRLKKIKKKYDPQNRFSHGFDLGMLGLEEALIDGI